MKPNENSQAGELGVHFFERVARNIPGIIFVYDTAERRNVYVNRAVEEYLGYTVEQFQAIADLALKTIHPQDLPAWESYIAGFERLADGEICGAEFRVKHADGSYRWLDFHSSVFARGTDGKVCQITGVALDVTDKKTADEALARSMKQYKMLFESIDEGFCVIEMLFDKNGKPRDYRFLEINPAFVNQTGLSGAGGRTIRELVPAHEEYWFEIYGKVALTGSPVRFENRAEGMNRWFDVYAFRCGGPESRIVAILFKDISAQKKAEEDLRLYAEELKRSNEELEQFANVASHDLQEPLRTVTVLSEYLAETSKGRLDQDALETIAAIESGARHAHQLTIQLLEYAKIGRAKEKFYQFSKVSLEGVLRDVLSDLKSSILEKQAGITHGPLPEVVGDEVQLKRLFQNLISNALKYAGAAVRIRIRAEQKDGEWVVSIQDNGIGIDLRDAERIFHVFQRLHSRSKYEGTGIGLAICKKIVGWHGGRIWMNSQVGKGSTFYFTLPVQGAVCLLTDSDS